MLWVHEGFLSLVSGMRYCTMSISRELTEETASALGVIFFPVGFPLLDIPEGIMESLV